MLWAWCLTYNWHFGSVFGSFTSGLSASGLSEFCDTCARAGKGLQKKEAAENLQRNDGGFLSPQSPLVDRGSRRYLVAFTAGIRSEFDVIIIKTRKSPYLPWRHFENVLPCSKLKLLGPVGDSYSSFSLLLLCHRPPGSGIPGAPKCCMSCSGVTVMWLSAKQRKVRGTWQ